MEIEVYKNKYGDERKYQIEIIGINGSRQYVDLLELPISVNGEKLTLKATLEKIFNDNRIMCEREVARIDKEVEVLKAQLEKQKEINKGLLEAIKDGGII